MAPYSRVQSKSTFYAGIAEGVPLRLPLTIHPPQCFLERRRRHRQTLMVGKHSRLMVAQLFNGNDSFLFQSAFSSLLQHLLKYLDTQANLRTHGTRTDDEHLPPTTRKASLTCFVSVAKSEDLKAQNTACLTNCGHG